MAQPELAHLELLAELDALADRLKRWAGSAPDEPHAHTARAVVRRLLERMGNMRIRMETPLVVATLGGTGVGKSALVNALAGAEIVETGRARPTTVRPAMICRPEITPKMLGIDPESVTLVHRDLPALVDLVVVDCPDPDTTEAIESPTGNLARLRQILPHCDVLVVATTQQKYRSARVADELAAAASGARLVFVQTHADQDQDIRDDWRKMLEPQYEVGQIFLVDSLAALADSCNGLQPRGEFAGLVDLLTRQRVGAAATRIRRANLLDLVEDSLAATDNRLMEGVPAIARLRQAIDEQRGRLGGRLSERMRNELLASRRQWENRLLGHVASRWGFSPFALVLRLYQAVGGLLSGALLYRAKTPAQVALWGAMEGARLWRKRRAGQDAEASAARAAVGIWSQAELRSAALVLEGYASEAGVDRQLAAPRTVFDEAARAGQAFGAGVAAELDAVLGRVARRHTGWFTRWRYELLLLAMLVVLLFRPAKNFFYDSWLGAPRAELLGLDFYVLSIFWLALWCVALLWSFTSRLRRGLRQEIDELAAGWNSPQAAAGIFVGLESACGDVERFRQSLDSLRQHVATLRRSLAESGEPLGHRRST